MADNELREAMADYMREISAREEHCPLTKPELLAVFRQAMDGGVPTDITSKTPTSGPRQRVNGTRAIDGKRELVYEPLPDHLLPEQVAVIRAKCREHEDRKRGHHG